MKLFFTLVCAFAIVGIASCMKHVSDKTNDSVFEYHEQTPYEYFRDSVFNGSEEDMERWYKNYESYLDTLWEAEPDYLMDIEAESDDYEMYVTIHEEWYKQ